MTTSVFIRNDSPKHGGHKVFVGIKYAGHDRVIPSTKLPLEPGDDVTTTVYNDMELIIRETE